MQKIKVFLILIAFLPLMLSAQDSELKTGEYLYRTFESAGDTLNYRIMYPNDFEESKSFPLVLFLHGAGERGDDNELQLVHGSRLFRDSIDKYPAIVVFPQCPKEDYWANLYRPDKDGAKRRFDFFYEKGPTSSMKMVLELVEELLEKPFIDPNRFYVSGLSMGGMGTFELSWRMQDKIACAMPICGGGDVKKAAEMSKVPYWVFHGAKDDVVNPRFSINMVKAIQQAGGKAKLSLYPDANHNSWDSAFSEAKFLSWMFSHRLNKTD